MTRASIEDTRRMLALLAQPGDVFELRGLVRVNGQQHTTSGFFDDLEALARAAAQRSGHDAGVYVTLNPVDPALLHRMPKNTVRRAGSGDTTSDRDVRRRRSLLVDVDPIRPAGISSTDQEHDAAIELAQRIAAELGELGWPRPIIADSGNGGHLIYAIDLPVDDGGLIKRVLTRLSATYTTPEHKVDEKVFNPARISKVYGTLTRKGENTTERPHRIARIISAPESMTPVDPALLESFAPEKSAPAKRDAPRVNGQRQAFDLDAWLGQHLPDARERSWESGRRWIVPVCPFNDQHDRGEAYVTQKHDGSIAAGCQHESCFKSWEQLRTHFEPDAYAYRDRNGHRMTDREVPPWLDAPDGVVYENPEARDELEAFAARDREEPPVKRAPAPGRAKWFRGPELTEEIWKRKDDPWVSLMLGTDELCRVRAGGIAVVMGGSGSGKSSLVSNIVLQHARDVGPAIVCSIELPADELAARIVGMKCDESWENVLRGHVKREHMAETLAVPRLYVLERDDATISNLRACVQAAADEYPGQPILAAIDYAQLVASAEREARAKVTDAFSQIDRIARDLRFVAVAVSQMSRASANAATSGEVLGAETAALGAESAAIERFASITLTLGKRGEERQDGSRSVELSVGKGRMSGLGDHVYALNYFGRTGKFRVDGEAKSATTVRSERDVEKASRKAVEIRAALVGAAHRAAAPLSRDQLQGMVSIGSKKERLAAITELLGTHELVEVARRAPRSRSFLIWTPDRQKATPGLQLASEMLREGVHGD